MFSGASYHKQEVDGSRSLSIANLKKGIENHQHSKLATQILITNTMGDSCVLDIVKKGTYLYLIGSKAVLYPLLFQQFPIYVMIICHFNTVNTLDMLESGYLQR